MNQIPLWSLSSFLVTQINHRKPSLETLKGSFQMFFSQIYHISKQLMTVPLMYIFEYEFRKVLSCHYGQHKCI
jgi:hypothetical protein